MPGVGAEPPVMAGEVAGSVSERGNYFQAVFAGPPAPACADRSRMHMSPPLPIIGAGERSVAGQALRDLDGVMVARKAKRIGVITRYSTGWGFLSTAAPRK